MHQSITSPKPSTNPQPFHAPGKDTLAFPFKILNKYQTQCTELGSNLGLRITHIVNKQHR